MRAGLRRVLSASLLVLLTGFAAQALAHALNVLAQAGEGVVTGEALYGDLSPAVGGVVNVLGADGAELARGRVGDDGRFELAVPAGAARSVVVMDDEGHTVQADIVAEAAGLAGQRNALAAEQAQVERQERIGQIVLVVILLAAAAWVGVRLWRRRRPPPC